ncbi:MAG TPA: aldose epimerase family protein [Bacteroidales bacterium]|nr:aldose epimerase family protein [Bacteroidales bacterium]HNS46512.1 aldose epimerase family protein [Bacteroidales bacterium]
MRVKFMITLIILLSIEWIGCRQKLSQEINQNIMDIKKEPFGQLQDNTQVYLFTLTNANGVILKVTNYGGIITSLEVPDINGQREDVVLGYDNLEGYLNETPYFGAIVGRYGNRIAGGKFILDGKHYTLAQNDNGNTLHGGLKGFDKVVWDAAELRDSISVGLRLHYLSPDGEEGFPGNLDVNVEYLLTNYNELVIHYRASTDKATPVNLTHHSYFNLNGAGNGTILDHQIQIHASAYTVVNELLIPTGELRDVTGTPMDFTDPVAIGARIAQVGGEPRGYDHNYVLNRPGLDHPVAHVTDPVSCRVMEVYTDQPGLQFYSGNFLEGSITGKQGKKYEQYYGFCLETQHFPDAPNQPAFPSTILRPGEVFESTTVYRFVAE